MSERRLDPSGDPGHHDVARDPWLPPELPEDARRMGLDRNTLEGAGLGFAVGLDRRRPSHLVLAWIGLAIFGLPVLIQLAALVR